MIFCVGAAEVVDEVVVTDAGMVTGVVVGNCMDDMACARCCGSMPPMRICCCVGNVIVVGANEGDRPIQSEVSCCCW